MIIITKIKINKKVTIMKITITIIIIIIAIIMILKDDKKITSTK